MIESDFYATEAGREHFANQLKSIRYCVQETCNCTLMPTPIAKRPPAHLCWFVSVVDVLYAYLTCGNYDCAPSPI